MTRAEAIECAVRMNIHRLPAPLRDGTIYLVTMHYSSGGGTVPEIVTAVRRDFQRLMQAPTSVNLPGRFTRKGFVCSP